MDRGAWQAIVHGVAESDMTKHTHIHTNTPDMTFALIKPYLGYSSSFPLLSPTAAQPSELLSKNTYH